MALSDGCISIALGENYEGSHIDYTFGCDDRKTSPYKVDIAGGLNESKGSP